MGLEGLARAPFCIGPDPLKYIKVMMMVIMMHRRPSVVCTKSFHTGSTTRSRNHALVELGVAQGCRELFEIRKARADRAAEAVALVRNPVLGAEALH